MISQDHGLGGIKQNHTQTKGNFPVNVSRRPEETN